MGKLVAFILSIVGLGGILTTTEFVNFRPEISTQLTKTILQNPNDDTPAPSPNNSTCPCNKSTGVITHGDGHKSPCPCENGECGCINKNKSDDGSLPLTLDPSSDTITGTACEDGQCTPTSSTQNNNNTTTYYNSRPILGRILRRR